MSVLSAKEATLGLFLVVSYMVAGALRAANPLRQQRSRAGWNEPRALTCMR